MKIEVPVDMVEIADQFEMQLDLRAAFGLELLVNSGG